MKIGYNNRSPNKVVCLQIQLISSCSVRILYRIQQSPFNFYCNLPQVFAKTTPPKLIAGLLVMKSKMFKMAFLVSHCPIGRQLKFHFENLYYYRYAIPLFLRIQSEMTVTSTFKQIKMDLVKDGFDPSKVNDALYYQDAAEKTFVPLDSALYKSILSGSRRL